MADLVRVAAVGDLHCVKTSEGALQPLFAEMIECADVIALAGDLVDYGLPEEAHVLVKEIGVALKAKVPVVAVLGNHDYEGGQPEAVKQILCEAGIIILDGGAVEIKGIGFAGVKGFCGGFGRRALEPWGESAIKSFVREALDEALKLESALARLRTPNRIALLHYAPIQGTVEGELKASGDVSVDNNANVQATIEGANVSVRGQVNGNVTARRRLTLGGSGRLNGDVKVARLTVEDGATLNGNVTMTPEKS